MRNMTSDKPPSPVAGLSTSHTRPQAIEDITKKLADQREARREQMQKQIEARVRSKKASSQAWEAERRK